MNRSILITATLIAVAVTTVAAQQQKPKFSGHWKANQGETGKGPGPYFAGQDFAATQDEKTLALVSTNPTLRQTEVRSAFKLDGSESMNSASSGGQVVPMVSKVTWDGKKMTISTNYRAPGDRAITMTQIWSIDDSGILKIVQSQVQFGRTNTSEWTYKKE